MLKREGEHTPPWRTHLCVFISPFTSTLAMANILAITWVIWIGISFSSSIFWMSKFLSTRSNPFYRSMNVTCVRSRSSTFRLWDRFLFSWRIAFSIKYITWVIWVPVELPGLKPYCSGSITVFSPYRIGESFSITRVSRSFVYVGAN